MRRQWISGIAIADAATRTLSAPPDKLDDSGWSSGTRFHRTLLSVLIEIAAGVAGVAAVGIVWAMAGGVRVVNQVERGIVFRFGRALKKLRQPGLAIMIPFVDRMKKVNIQVVTMPIPAQDGMTRDNVSVRVDAVVYFRVDDPMRAAIEVQDYLFAVGQVAQTSLRSIIGKSELDDLLSSREKLHQGLELLLEMPAMGWGLTVDRVEIKDVQVPESMKRSMSRQAEAERERRSRIIMADGEFQAAQKLADASRIMSGTPEALQLRLLQTVVEVAAEKNSTLVMPVPIELLRFFERAAGGTPAHTAPQQAAPTPVEPAAAASPLPGPRTPALSADAVDPTMTAELTAMPEAVADTDA